MVFLVKFENKKKLCFTNSCNDDDFNLNNIPPRAYELESLNNEIKQICFTEGYFAELNYPIVFKPNFSTLGSFTEIKLNSISNQASCTPDDSIRNLLAFKPVVLYEKINLPDKPDDILSFESIFQETDIAQRKVFEVNEQEIFTFLQWI